MKGFVLVDGSFFIVVILCNSVSCKECFNNFPPEYHSHTFRVDVQSANDGAWKKEVVSKYRTTTKDLSAGASKVGSEEDSGILRDMKIPGGGFKFPARDFLKEVSLHDVRLLPNSLHFNAQQTNLKYLLMLDVDRLVWNFRKTAGLPAPGIPYGGWEGENVELRGHFVGHYLSATALTWASTRNEVIKQKMTALVSALFECQQKIGTGYLSAFPTEFFDRLERLVFVWAPYYTIHKILAGLLDQYTLANHGQALNIAVWMVDYFNTRVQNLISNTSLERHYQTLNEECGGMNDVLYRLFGLTKDPKHLKLAELFDKPCFLEILAAKADDIAGLHSNTHIPIISGVQRRYELTGDEKSKDVGTFFMDIINSSHAYATGGTSEHEFWSLPKKLADNLTSETEESCTTYNMLKVSRFLFTWTKQIAYADYYERALTNGVIGIQRGSEPGAMIYMLPLAPGSSKARTFHGWGTPSDTFWCCYGTGIESFSKIGDSIYFEQQGKVPGLYIIQYVSSTFHWQTAQVLVHQNVGPIVSWDSILRMSLSFTPNKGTAVPSFLNLRIPFWTNPIGGKATLNNQNLPLPAPGNFLSVTRTWSPADKILIQLPINLWTEAIKDDRPLFASLQAIFYGPYLLAGYSKGDFHIKTGPVKSLTQWITPIPPIFNSGLVTLSQQSGQSTFVLMQNQSVTMEPTPLPGIGGEVYATFRLISNDALPVNFSVVQDVIGKLVMLEPFDLPGMLLMQQGTEDYPVVSKGPGNSVFQVNPGLDGRADTVSLELVNRKGCFLYSGVNIKAGTILKLSCNAAEAGFKQAVSFVMQKGMCLYNPLSFVAKGSNRNYLLAPLFIFRDETYTVYFNITL